MGVTWITPQDVALPDTGNWYDIDCSSYIAAGATGVILQVRVAGTITIGFRKNGSTDNLTDIAYSGALLWLTIGVDGDRIFEAYTTSLELIAINIVGYFDSDATFFTNITDITPETTNEWVDVDVSGNTGGDTAIGVLLHVLGNGSSNWGVRKNGSTDDRKRDTDDWGAACIGVDGSEILEIYNPDSVTFYLVGYIKAGATFLTNATDLSLGDTESWTDLSTLPEGATGAIIEVDNTGDWSYIFGFRENGSAQDVTGNCGGEQHSWGMIKADSNRVVEGYISNVAVDFYLVGYTTAAAAGGSIIPRIMQYYRRLRS